MLHNCPNGHGPLIHRENDYHCPACHYSFTATKRRGNKYVEEVNRTIKTLWVSYKLRYKKGEGERTPLFHELDKRNYDSGYCYRGINRWMTALYPDIAFITKDSIKKRGLSLTDDAEGLVVAAWVMPKLTKEQQLLPKVEQNELLKKKRPFMVTHTVYAANSIEGLEPKEFPEDSNTKKFESIDAFIRAIGVTVKEGGNKSFYDWTNDTIVIPRHQQFETEEDYYRELFRQVAISSGHKSRLNRDEVKYQRNEKFGREALLAEFASSYICKQFGIIPDNKVIAELEHWFDAIDRDPHLLVSASQQAEKVLDFYFRS